MAQKVGVEHFRISNSFILMKSSSNKGLFSHLRSDLPASIVVFLVAMPLCLGIALASFPEGMAPNLFSGLIAGIVGGIIVGTISGSHIGVSGPAAGLAVIVAAAIGELGAFNVFLLSVVLAGVIQILLGVLRAGVIGYYFPNSVIKGMLAGIGVLIFFKQIPHVMGYDKVPWGEWSFFQSDGENTFSEVLIAAKDISAGSLIIAGISLAILILWERPFMKRIALFKWIQGPLVAVVTGIVLFSVFGSEGTYGLRDDQMVSIPVSSSISGFFGQFTFPDWSAIWSAKVWSTALVIAVVASLETLLCVEATDKLDPHKRITPTNRELMAQGAGNMVSGLIGGLPVTQVIVRSSANIQSGGRTKMSAVIHGVLLLVSVMIIPDLLNRIPLASLAAILLVVGWKLAKPALFRSQWNAGLTQFLPFIVTILGIVFIDLLWGVGLGLIVAIIQIMWNNYRLPYHLDEEDMENGVMVLRLSEDVSFLNKAPIQRVLNELPEGGKIRIDASGTNHIHPDVEEIIQDFMVTSEERGIEVEYVGAPEVTVLTPIQAIKKALVRSATS